MSMSNTEQPHGAEMSIERAEFFFAGTQTWADGLQGARRSSADFAQELPTRDIQRPEAT